MKMTVKHMLGLTVCLVAGTVSLGSLTAVADQPGQAVHRVRPGQKTFTGQPGKAALQLVEDAQTTLKSGDWNSAYQELLLADDEITHMHPNAEASSNNVKGRPDMAHMMTMRSDLRTALRDIEEGHDAAAQTQLNALKGSIKSMMP